MFNPSFGELGIIFFAGISLMGFWPIGIPAIALIMIFG